MVGHEFVDGKSKNLLVSSNGESGSSQRRLRINLSQETHRR